MFDEFFMLLVTIALGGGALTGLVFLGLARWRQEIDRPRDLSDI